MPLLFGCLVGRFGSRWDCWPYYYFWFYSNLNRCLSRRQSTSSASKIGWIRRRLGTPLFSTLRSILFLTSSIFFSLFDSALITSLSPVFLLNRYLFHHIGFQHHCRFLDNSLSASYFSHALSSPDLHSAQFCKDQHYFSTSRSESMKIHVIRKSIECEFMPSLVESY